MSNNTSTIFTDINSLSFDIKEKADMLHFFTYNDTSETDKVKTVLSTIEEDEVKVEYLRRCIKQRDEHPAMRKRKANERCSAVPKRKKFSVNSTIMPWERENVYYVNPINQSKELIDLIHKGEYVLLHGPRASGKSTRTLQIMDYLEEEGYVCIYVVFGDLTVDVDLFWEKVAGSLKRNLDIKCKEKFKLGKTEPFEIPAMKTLEDIMNVFALEAEIWRYLFEEPDRKVILFFDEFDTLLSPNQKQVCDSFLTNLRIIKTSPHYAIKSVVGIGTFSILNLNTSNRSVSPFNVSDAFKNPNFTEDEVKLIYDEFINEYGLEIDDLIIKDIYVQTNGHSGLVNLCGRVIESCPNKLDYASWKLYEIEKLGDEISKYRTFKRMTDDLKIKDAMILSGVILLRTRFLGTLNDVKITDNKELELVEFLISEGVLMETGPKTFKMFSPFVDSLIRRHVIADLFPLAPSIHVPKERGIIKTLEVVKEAIRFFDKEIISRAYHNSFKTAHVYVGGILKNLVPRESVYDVELNRILNNWLSREIGAEITSQWHLIHEKDNRCVHNYSDLVINIPHDQNDQLIVLELMATVTESIANEHFARALAYAKELSANEVWVIHFTCEDKFNIHPYFPSEKLLKEGLRVIIFWHNSDFTDIRMCTSWWENGVKKEIINEKI
ncbi:unnamed protein product [Rhizophagus irregularis]|nr:unnamed protein product [Rhizophagus irregularis]